MGDARTGPFAEADYRSLAAFRAGLRRFLRFSEEAARAAGLSPQQHQLLLAVRGHPGPEPPTVGDLAEALQVRHHSAVGLIDRMAEAGLVRRERSAADSRRVFVAITEDGEAVLRRLTAAHRQELRRLGSLLRPLAEAVGDRGLDEGAGEPPA